MVNSKKVKYRLCWYCNNQFYAFKSMKVLYQGHIREVHRNCAKILNDLIDKEQVNRKFPEKVRGKDE